MKGERRLRILFIAWDGPQVSYLESLFLPIFAGLKAHGYHFDILQFRWGDRRQEEEVARACREAGCGYRAVRIWRWGGGAGPFLSALLGGRPVRNAVEHFGSDVIMPRSVLPSLAVLAGRASRMRPVLLDSDGLEVDERVEFSGLKRSGLAYRLLRDIEAQMVRLSSGVLVRTGFGRDVLVARGGPGVEAERFHIVSNGRDGAVFHPGDEASRQAVRAELGIAKDAPLIVYAGSVGGKYRTRRVGELALAVRSRRPDARLLLLSGSPELARQELIGTLPELEAFTTIMRAAPLDVPRYLAAADLGTAFIAPTFSMRSAAPVKTGEYLLCGLPVVGVAAVGNNAPLIEQGVFFDDERGLEEAARWFVDEVLANRDGYRTRARAAGVAQFSLTSSIAAYRVALDQIASLTRPDSLDNIPRDIPAGTPASRA